MGIMDVRSVQQQSLNTADGATTQDFTVSGFGTPVAWIVTVSYGTTAGVIRSGAGLNVGWQETTSPDTESVFFGAGELSSNYASSTFGGGSGVIRTLVPGSTAVEMQASAAAISNGIRLTYATKPTTRVLITVDLIICDNAVAGDATGSSGSVSGLGFQPQAILTMNLNGSGAPVNGWRGSLGFAAEGIGQASMSQRFEIGVNAPVTIGQIVKQNRFSTQLTSTLGVWAYQLDSFDAGGFSWSLIEGSNFNFSYLAIRASDASFAAGRAATGSSLTRVQAFAGTNPSVGAFFVSTYLDTLDTVENNNDKACSTGFHSWTSSEEHSSSTSLEDNSSPANAHARASTSGFDVLDYQGNLAIEGSPQGYQGGITSGFDIVYTTGVSGRYFLYLTWTTPPVLMDAEDELGISSSAELVTFNPVFPEDTDTLGIQDEAHLLVFTPQTMAADDMGAAQAARSGMEAGQAGRSGMEAGQSKLQ